MNYRLDSGKTVKIPDSEIENNMKVLELTRDEAIQMWLEDEGYLDNQEQLALEEKASKARITATIHKASAVDKRKRKSKEDKPKTFKANPTKEKVISELAKFLETLASDIEIANPGKLIYFKVGDMNLKLDLIQRKKI